jgi:predicted outer membrane repeat protein
VFIILKIILLIGAHEMRFSLLTRFILFLLFVSVLASTRLPNAQASTLTVTSVNDSGATSLRSIIANAGAGDTIVFNVGGSGTINFLAGQITIDKNLIIDGAGQRITLSGTNTNRLFHVLSNSNVELRNLTITQGFAADGGGGILNYGNLTLINCIFSNNVASQSEGKGGAIYTGVLGSSLAVVNSFFSNNQAPDGGAIYSHEQYPMTISGTTFSGNTALNGGAILTASTLTMSNSTFINNTATLGGAIYQLTGSASIISSTFKTNSGSSPGGNLAIYGVLSLTGSILDNGTFGNSCAGNGTGISGGYNISGDDSCTFLDQTGDLQNTNPLLGTLSNNGGITQTIPLLVGSPAIDAYSTNCPTVDQRGISRPRGSACDIGAYEAIPSPLVVTNLNNSGAGSLRETVLNARPGDTIIFGLSGTITLATPIVITQNVVIDGVGQTVTISGGNTSRMFTNNTGITLEINHLTLSGGNATAISGGAILNNGGTLRVFNSTLSGNRASSSGAISSSGTLVVDNTTFSQNTASNTGGALSSGGSLTMTNSRIINNSSTNGAGLSLANNSTVTISNTTISGNIASVSGGGINAVGATLTLSNSTVSNNSAGTGGGIRNTVGTVTIINSTLSGNSATSGGAISNISIVNIYNSTIANNVASTGSGIHMGFGSPSNTTNFARSIIVNDCFVQDGRIVDSANNLSFPSACGPITAGSNPLLLSLADNDGSTQTHALDAGSPAINAYSANCPATDQRGIVRPQGAACDIGAFELVPPIEVTPEVTPTEETTPEVTSTVTPEVTPTEEITPEVTSTATPEVTPEVTPSVTPPPTMTTITENEFYAAVEAARASYPDINNIVIDFVSNGMNLTVVTHDGVVGIVTFTLTQEQGFVSFAIGSITVNGSDAPASYVNIINRDLPAIFTTALDTIATDRFGSGFDVDTISLTGDTLVVTVGEQP